MKVPELTTSVTIGSLLLTLFFSAPAFCAVSPEAYVNRTHGFSINPPIGWTVDESGAYGTVVIFYGPVIPETGGKINININAGTAIAKLEECVSGVKQWLSVNFTNYNLVSEGSRNVSGVDGYELVFTWTCMPGANVSNTYAFNVKQKQVLFVEKGRAYVITFTASPTNYDDYLPAFEESLQTFKLLGQEFSWLTPLYMLIIGIIIGAWSIVGVGILIKWKKMKTQQGQKRLMSVMVDMLRLQKSVKIEDLAKMLGTKEVDVELAVIRLRKNGVPISFNRETREVLYEKEE